MEETVFCVYAHYKTGEEYIPFYIGKGKKHRPYAVDSRNKHWHNVVKKHGYYVKILAENLSEFDAFYLEKQLIGMFGRSDLGKGPLVNKTDGGEGTTGPHTKEHNKNISIALTGRTLSDEHRKKCPVFPIGHVPWNKNKPGCFNEDTIQQMRDSHKGQIPPNKGIPASEETKELIRIKRKLQVMTPHTPETKIDMSEKRAANWKRFGPSIFIYNVLTKEVKRHKKEEEIPEGWERGRGKGNNKKTQIYNIVTLVNKRISKDQPIPEGWARGKRPNANTTSSTTTSDSTSKAI